MKDKFSIVYQYGGTLVHVSSKACGGTQDRIEWSTWATAHKWLKAFRKITQGTPFGKSIVPYITKNGSIVDPEVTAVGGNMLKGFTLYFYNTTVVLDKAETQRLKDARGLQDLTDFMGLNYFEVLDIIKP